MRKQYASGTPTPIPAQGQWPRNRWKRPSNSVKVIVQVHWMDASFHDLCCVYCHKLKRCPNPFIFSDYYPWQSPLLWYSSPSISIIFFPVFPWYLFSSWPKKKKNLSTAQEVLSNCWWLMKLRFIEILSSQVLYQAMCLCICECCLLIGYGGVQIKLRCCERYDPSLKLKCYGRGMTPVCHNCWEGFILHTHYRHVVSDPEW